MIPAPMDIVDDGKSPQIMNPKRAVQISAGYSNGPTIGKGAVTVALVIRMWAKQQNRQPNQQREICQGHGGPEHDHWYRGQ